MRKYGLLVPVLLVLAIPIVLLIDSKQASIKLVPAITVIGSETPVKLEVVSPHGLRRLTAFIEQNNQRQKVYETTLPARRFSAFRKSEAAREITFPAGKKQAPALTDGKARFIIEAVSNDLRAAVTVEARDVDVNTKPPALAVDGAQHYINQGGSELVTFTVSGYWTEAGVRVGKYTFRSFPMPGKPAEERFSLFAYPWDLPSDAVPMVYERNPSGSEVTARFWYKLFPKRFRTRDLELDDKFLETVVNQIDPAGTGDLITRFLRINGDMRRRNNQTLSGLRSQTAEKFLWTGPFQQLGNSKVESQFADQRSYIYKGRKVDQQMHLGFDLSVTSHVGVVASNSGKVLYASDLGIYGNCIVVDHGFGLQSIYGHLNEISVKPGDMVKKGQVMGKSGSTGLAGGDHLHYSMQVDGVQVNPVEWWDEHWIKDRILSKISQ